MKMRGKKHKQLKLTNHREELEAMENIILRMQTVLQLAIILQDRQKEEINEAA